MQKKTVRPLLFMYTSYQNSSHSRSGNFPPVKNFEIPYLRLILRGLSTRHRVTYRFKVN